MNLLRSFSAWIFLGSLLSFNAYALPASVVDLIADSLGSTYTKEKILGPDSVVLNQNTGQLSGVISIATGGPITPGDTLLSNVAGAEISLQGFGVTPPNSASTHTSSASVAANGYSFTVTDVRSYSGCQGVFCVPPPFNWTKVDSDFVARTRPAFEFDNVEVSANYFVTGASSPFTDVEATLQFGQRSLFLDDGKLKAQLGFAAEGVEIAERLFAGTAVKETLGGVIATEAVSGFISFVTDQLVQSNAVGLAVSVFSSALLSGALALVVAQFSGVVLSAGALTSLFATTIAVSLAFGTVSGTLKLWAADPPDFNYSERVAVETDRLANFNELAALSSTDLSFANNLLLASLYSTAALDSYERYQGALIFQFENNTDTTFFQELQLEDTRNFLALADFYRDLGKNAFDESVSSLSFVDDPVLFDYFSKISLALDDPRVLLNNEVSEPSSINLLLLAFVLLWSIRVRYSRSLKWRGL